MLGICAENGAWAAWGASADAARQESNKSNKINYDGVLERTRLKSKQIDRPSQAGPRHAVVFITRASLLKRNVQRGERGVRRIMYWDHINRF
jgi:hypothetical protein